LLHLSVRHHGLRHYYLYGHHGWTEMVLLELLELSVHPCRGLRDHH